MAVLGTGTTDTAWNVLAHVGALTPVTFTSLPAPVRNLATGQTTAAGTSYAVHMLIRGYRRSEMDGVSVVSGDMLARIPHAVLAVVPTTRDTVTWGGVVWSVVTVAEGANGAWWRLQLRRPRPV